MSIDSALAGTLIVLGAPSHDMLGIRLERLGALPNRVVIVDPQADSILTEQPGVERIPAVVSDADGEAELSTYSVAGLRSFTPPTSALMALFPRLRAHSILPVQVVSVDSLLARLGQLPDPIRLWIDLPSQEVRLLQDCQEAGILERAENLMIRCGIERFFAGTDDSATVQGWLEGAGFELAELDETDPDWPDMFFRRNGLAQELSCLKTRIAAQDLELGEVRKALEAREDEYAALAQQAAELSDQMQSQKKDFKGQILKLEADLQTASEALKRSEAKTDLARSDLALQMRLKEMQKLDLDHLRQRFEENEERRRQQEELLLKLTPRLSEASERLRQLQLESGTAYTLPDEKTGNASKSEAPPVQKSRGKSPSKRSNKA